MSTLTVVVVAALLGGLVGLGALVLVAALTGRAVVPERWLARTGRHIDRAVLRLGLAIGGAILAFLATRWPVVALFAAGFGCWLPSAMAASGRTATEIAKVEAIATWTEQLRDTLAAANGLESAIGATTALAPRPIAAAVERLGARLEYERTAAALRTFAVEVDHPVADFVIAALVVAAEHQARDLATLLGQLAVAARDEAAMRTRVWVGRARTRTSVRVIAAVVPLMVGAVMALDRHYFEPYDTASGQVALAVIGLVFLASFAGMERMGRIDVPDRFIGRSGAPA